MYLASLGLMQYPNAYSSALPFLMDPRGLMATLNAYFPPFDVHQANFISNILWQRPQELKTLKCDTMTHAKLPLHYGHTDAKVNIVLILVIEKV